MTIAENRLHADPGIEGHEQHPRRSAIVETDMQRDRAKTIYEKSKPGRRAFVAPELDVPKHELPSAVPPHGAAEAAGDRRAGDRPPLQPALQAQLRPRHGLLPARLVHDEAQPEAARARRGAAGQRAPAPAAEPKRAQGALQLMHELQGALGEVAGLPHVSLQPRAGSPRRARRRPAHPRLPRGPRRPAHEDPHPRHRARDQPGDGDDGRLRGRQGRHRRARRRRRRGPARQGRRERRLPDAHQPEHARRVRPQHRGDRQDRPRRRRDAVLRRREPQRGHGAHAPGRHGLRHRALQPAQDVHAAARRRRPGRRPDRGLRPHRAVPDQAAGRQARRRHVRPRLRPAEVDRPPARLPGQLRRVRALLRVHPQPRLRRPAGGVARPRS